MSFVLERNNAAQQVIGATGVDGFRKGIVVERTLMNRKAGAQRDQTGGTV